MITLNDVARKPAKYVKAIAIIYYDEADHLDKIQHWKYSQALYPKESLDINVHIRQEELNGEVCQT